MQRGSAAVSSHRDGPQPALAVAPVGEVGVQEALEDAAVVGGEQMNQLVDDDEFTEVAREDEQFAVEGEAAGVGIDGGGGVHVAGVGAGDRAGERAPFGGHGADVDGRRAHAHARGPVTRGPAQLVGVAPAVSWTFSRGR